MEAQPREIRRYTTVDGRTPFVEWLNSLRDSSARFRINSRLRRVALGNLGDYRQLEKEFVNSGLTMVLVIESILGK